MDMIKDPSVHDPNTYVTYTFGKMTFKTIPFD